MKRMALCLDYLEELRDQVMKGETNDAAVAGEDEKEVADQLDLCDDGDGAGQKSGSTCRLNGRLPEAARRLDGCERLTVYADEQDRTGTVYADIPG